MKKLSLLLLVALVAISTTSPARTRHRAHHRHVYGSAPAPAGEVGVSAIYTLSGCPHCAELESYVAQSGARVYRSNTSQRHFSMFPTVVYTDGSADYGDRIYSHSVRIPGAVRVIETQ